MARPTRNSPQANISGSSRIFFATTKTSMGKPLLQSERNAMLLIDVLRSCVATRKFHLHDFVVMPDHIHILIELHSGISIEKAMQLIKGGFSYRLKRKNGYLGDVWQTGFSEVRIYDDESLAEHRRYIAQNPVKAGLSDSSEEYPYCFNSLAKNKREQGLKPE